MKYVLVIAGIICFNYLLAQEKYSLLSMDPILLKDAMAVIREEQTVFEIHSPGKATIHSKYAVTILNASAKDFGEITISYSGKSARSVNGSVYDASGRKVRDLKKDDISDYSASGNGTFHTDARFMVINMSLPQYPYTVEVEYSKDLDGLLFYPSYRPQPSPSVSVEKSEFIIKAPMGHTFRYQGSNFTFEAEITTEKNVTNYRWTASHLKAFDMEPYGPDRSKILPVLYVGPNEFVMGGYPGKMNTWEDLSSWYFHLNKGRDVLLPDAQQTIIELTRELKTPTEKIQKVYEYMQSKTRYVGVQLGIGGWQTLEASHVDEYGWGDCKALTNYTKALLGSIGIESHEALVRAGASASDIFVDFPSSQFNHVILCVPNQGDTVWLECTSQIAPFDYVGDFTDDRHVLIVKDKGGHLIKTPSFTPEENVQTREVFVNVSENNEATAHVITKYRGQQYENDNLFYYLSASEDELEKKLYKAIDIPSFKIDSFSFNNNRNRQPELTLDLKLTLNNYANISGKRFILPLNLMNKHESIPRQMEKREHPVVVRYSFMDIDTVHYKLPTGMHAEFMPEPTSIKSIFGEYESVITIDEANNVTYIRRLLLKKGTFSAETYEDLRSFLKEVAKADQLKAVFLRRT